MSGLEQAFYIISIIYMSIMFLLIVALLVAVFVIRNKVVSIQRQIEEKVNTVTTIAEKGGEVAAAVVGGVTRKAKKSLKR